MLNSFKARKLSFQSKSPWQPWNLRFSCKLVNTPLHSVEGDSTRINLFSKKRMNWQRARHVSLQFASFWYTSKVKSQSRMKLGHENGDSWRSFLQNSENNSKQTALVRKVIQNSRKSYHNIITAVHSLFEHKSFAIISKLPLKLNANPCSSRLVGFMKAGSLRPRGAFSDKTILQRCFNSASTHRVSRIMKIYQSKLWVCLQNKFAFFLVEKLR